MIRTQVEDQLRRTLSRLASETVVEDASLNRLARRRQSERRRQRVIAVAVAATSAIGMGLIVTTVAPNLMESQRSARVEIVASDPPAHETNAGNWGNRSLALPGFGDGIGGICAYTYPADLPGFEFALDGTVTSIEKGATSEAAGATRLSVSIAVNEVFIGDVDDTAVLFTWSYDTDADGEYEALSSIVGSRLLIATNESKELVACGFTRTYSDEEAHMWRTAFAD